MALVRAAVASAPLAWTIPSPVLLLALRRAADVAVFSPVLRFFRASLGTSVLSYEFSLLFLGYAYGVAFFCSPCLFSASLYPTVASLVCFSCGPPSLVVPVYVYVCGVSFYL